MPTLCIITISASVHHRLGNKPQKLAIAVLCGHHTDRKSSIISAKRSNDIPSVPCAVEVQSSISTIEIFPAMFCTSKPGQVTHVDDIILWMIYHRPPDVKLHEGALRQDLLDSSSELHQACLTSLMSKESRSWDQDIGASTKSGISYFQLQYLFRDFGNQRVGRTQIEPWTCLCNDLIRCLTSIQIRICWRQWWNENTRLLAQTPSPSFSTEGESLGWY